MKTLKKNRFFNMHFIVINLILFLCLNEKSIAQTCDVIEGSPITITVSNTSQLGYQVTYVLANASGVIIATSSTPSFPLGTTEDLVQVVGISYPIGATISGLTVGQSIFNLSGCFCTSNHVWLIVCDSNGTANVTCPFIVNQTLSITSTGSYISTPSCILRYVMTNELGVILSISSSPNFTTPSNGGVYEFYILSSSSATSISGLSVGQNIANITGCFELSDYVGTIVCDPVALSVQLLDFNATLNQNDQVDITWSTISEKDNDYFTILRSKNGIDWESIEVVDGAGNSNTLLNYVDLDPSPLDGLSYYRLKQTDFNGAFFISEMRLINRKLNTNDIIVYPNPCQGLVNIQSNNGKEIPILIYSSDGRLVFELIVKDEINVELSSGLYYLTMIENQFQNTQKIVVY